MFKRITVDPYVRQWALSYNVVGDLKLLSFLAGSQYVSRLLKYSHHLAQQFHSFRSILNQMRPLKRFGYEVCPFTTQCPTRDIDKIIIFQSLLFSPYFPKGRVRVSSINIVWNFKINSLVKTNQNHGGNFFSKLFTVHLWRYNVPFRITKFLKLWNSHLLSIYKASKNHVIRMLYMEWYKIKIRMQSIGYEVL